MVIVDIIKPPLYGTAVWNGSDFVYTPNILNANIPDYFIYTKTTENATQTLTKRINLNATVPNVKNPSVNVDSTQKITINVSNLTDQEYAFITEVESPVNGILTFNNFNIVYESGIFNATESLSYKVFNDTYEAIGTLTVNTVNGIDQNYTELNYKDKLNYASQNFSTLSSGKIRWNSTYYTLSANRNNWDSIDTSRFQGFTNYIENGNFVDTINYIYTDKLSIYDTLCGSISVNNSKWSNDYSAITGIYNYLNGASALYNFNYDFLNSYKSDWDNSYTNNTELTSFAIPFNNTLNSLVSTYNNNNYKWAVTNLNYISSIKSSLWDSLSDISYNGWNLNFNNITSLSVSLVDFDKTLDNTTNTIAICANKWYYTYNTLRTFIPYFNLWDQSYDYINNNLDTLQALNTTVNSFTAKYFIYVPRFNSLYSTINTPSTTNAWTANLKLTLALTKSAYWNDLYNTVLVASSSWVFDENYPSLAFYTPFQTSSAKWNVNVPQLSNNWNRSNQISSTSASYLTGSNSITLLTKDISFYGDTLINNNLSAFGSKTSINTNVYTTSTFEVSSSGTDTALFVEKDPPMMSGIADFTNVTNSLTTTVLYVKSPKYVSVNTYDNPTEFCVMGDISASGNIYPLGQLFTGFDSKSANYDTAYNYVTSTSASINSFNNNSLNYNSLVSYINLSASNITQVINNSSNYVNLYNIINSQSSNNNICNNFIGLCAVNFGVDTVYQSTSSTYQEMVLNVNKLKSGGYIISRNFTQFNGSAIQTPTTLSILLKDDIILKSWAIYSDVQCSASVRILSSDITSYNNGAYVDSAIEQVNLTNSYINSSNILRNWTTTLYKGTILSFSLLGNDNAKTITVSLSVDKQ